MATSQPDITELKSRMKDAWMAGNFGEIARFTEKTAEEFAARLNIEPGSNILDVACGTGNTVIPLARAGVRMIGVDIASNLLEQARARAHKERLKVGFREGDAEQLGFPDVMFDGVISMFGAMFAPRPEMVVSELVRVTRPGGMIAMANWTPEGFTGKMFKATAKHVPPPPGVPPPVLWGDETTVRQRFGDRVKDMRCTRIKCDFEYPFPPAEVVEFFRRYFGPTNVAFSRLDEAGQKALTADLVQLWNDNNQRKDGTSLVSSEYLEVVAVRV